MRQCKCGGTINQYPLTKNRTAWNCDSCGRYEQLAEKNDLKPIPAPIKQIKKSLSETCTKNAIF